LNGSFQFCCIGNKSLIFVISENYLKHHLNHMITLHHTLCNHLLPAHLYLKLYITVSPMRKIHTVSVCAYSSRSIYIFISYNLYIIVSVSVSRIVSISVYHLFSISASNSHYICISNSLMSHIVSLSVSQKVSLSVSNIVSVSVSHCFCICAI